MTSPDPADVKRVEHARRVLSEASNGLLTADWGTLYWIAEQVPQLLDVIDHLLPEASESGMCKQCGILPAVLDGCCGEECRANWRVSEYRGWYPR